MRALVLDDDSWEAVRAAVTVAVRSRFMNVTAAPLLRARDALDSALAEDRAVHEIAVLLEREYEWPEIGDRDWCSVAGDALSVLERATDGR